MPQRHTPQAIARARELRKRQTEAESLLWYALRGRRLCGLKFRRQFPVEPFIADFACVEEHLIVEIEQEFGIPHSRWENADGSFDSMVRYVTQRIAATDRQNRILWGSLGTRCGCRNNPPYFWIAHDGKPAEPRSR